METHAHSLKILNLRVSSDSVTFPVTTFILSSQRSQPGFNDFNTYCIISRFQSPHMLQAISDGITKAEQKTVRMVSASSGSTSAAWASPAVAVTSY